ncbi:MAG TPA: hypothetical protein VLS52_04800 [Rudaea sp.]|nr:hypothetical protein [Rudaea sp.]
MAASRLMARLRDHDWLAAVIELAIVVVGILIALQVSNWNQDRVDRNRAQSYYRRIHADLSADLKSMDATLAFWRAVSAYGSQAIADGENRQGAGAADWKTVLAYYQASQTMPFVPADNAFAEMRSAGDLGLVGNEPLRKRLEDYYSLSGVGGQSIIRQQDPAYRLQIRGLTPWPVQEYIWTRCFSESSYITQQFVDCPSSIDARQASALLDSYRHAPDLLNQLRAWMSTLRISIMVLVNDRRDANELDAAVTRAMKR